MGKRKGLKMSSKGILLLFITMLLFTQLGHRTQGTRIATCEDSKVGEFDFDSINETELELLNNQNYSSKGLIFENVGQIREADVLFYYTYRDYSYGFRESIISITSTVSKLEEVSSYDVWFEGSNTVEPTASCDSDYSINYFLGDEFIANVNGFSEITYFDIYDGIDLKYYITDLGLKYEFIVHPYSSPEQIKIRLDDSISLVIEDSEVKGFNSNRKEPIFQDKSLYVFQENKTSIKSKFKMEIGSNGYSFEIGDYDENKLLIIDPYLIDFSTYFGGNGSDLIRDIVRDSEGNIVVGGHTSSLDFYLYNPYQSDIYDDVAFITKLDPTGTSVIFSTIIGGTGEDILTALTIDSADNIIILGSTYSTDFPTFNPFQTNQPDRDIFVTKLNSTGNGLLFSTYLGGNDEDVGMYGIDVDDDGNVYLIGVTDSTDFPTLNSYQFDQEYTDTVITKLNSTGNGLIFSTYLGGDQDDWGRDLTIDQSGHVYVTGYTGSTDFPTKLAYQADFGGVADVFVTKLYYSGDQIVFSTYLGGTARDRGYAIELDSRNNIYITGLASSSNYPTMNPYKTLTDSQNTIITKLNYTGIDLIYSSFAFGTEGTNLDIDKKENVYITGRNDNEIFAVKIDTLGTNEIFSTELGEGYGWGINVARNEDFYIAGVTTDAAFSTTNPIDDVFEGSNEAFIAKYRTTPPEITLKPDIYNYTEGTSGHNLTWRAIDTNPGIYTIYRNGSKITSNPWYFDSPIIVNITGLSAGVYNYTIDIQDFYEYSTVDTVFVEVEKPPYTQETSFHGFLSIIQLSLLIIILKKRKKKKI